MNIITTLQAGQAQEYSERGDFFRLMDAGGPVSVIFYRAGAEVARAEAVGEGYAEKFDQGDFDKVRIESATLVTVHFITRLGNQVGYDKAPTGDVNIANRRGTIGRINASIGWAAATTIANANPARNYVLVQNTDASIAIRLRVDGTDPTATTGLRIPPGGYWESSANFAPTAAIKVCAESGVVAVEGLEG